MAPGCRRRAAHAHHVVYRQELRWHRGDPDDDRNLVPLCLACHGAHHNRQAPLPLRVLPDGAFAFAEDLLGAGAAYEYLRRRYAGEDMRLDALR